MSTSLGLFYAKRFGNHVPFMFMFTYFLQSFFLHIEYKCFFYTSNKNYLFFCHIEYKWFLNKSFWQQHSPEFQNWSLTTRYSIQDIPFCRGFTLCSRYNQCILSSANRVVRFWKTMLQFYRKNKRKRKINSFE